MGMAKSKAIEKNTSTEERLKEAARVVFTKKGYSSTKTRDIAKEAGINLALLNYYFRSKEKLFEIVMLEKIQQLFSFIAPVFNDPSTSLNEKIDKITVQYIDMLLQYPDLPLFVLSEIRNNPERFAKSVQLDTYIMNSHFIKQLAEKKKEVNPVQLLINFLGMLVFPFIAKPVFQATGTVKEKAYRQMIEERKILIPRWMKLMLK
jgi:AcrR family transcriptional regulator